MVILTRSPCQCVQNVNTMTVSTNHNFPGEGNDRAISSLLFVLTMQGSLVVSNSSSDILIFYIRNSPFIHFASQNKGRFMILVVKLFKTSIRVRQSMTETRPYLVSRNLNSCFEYSIQNFWVEVYKSSRSSLKSHSFAPSGCSRHETYNTKQFFFFFFFFFIVMHSKTSSTYKITVANCTPITLLTITNCTLITLLTITNCTLITLLTITK